MLGFGTEAECIVRGNELILRPVKTNTGGEFAEQVAGSNAEYATYEDIFGTEK